MTKGSRHWFAVFEIRPPQEWRWLFFSGRCVYRPTGQTRMDAGGLLMTSITRNMKQGKNADLQRFLLHFQ